MSEYRSISVCNVVYKLVSKVLNNRLRKFLPDIITVNQSVFVPRRLLTHNVLIAFELFHYMKNLKHVEGCMALKLDMSKAYDRIKWKFLEATMLKFGLDRDWCERVMECVRTFSFSVLINGNPTNEFTPCRGLGRATLYLPTFYFVCRVFSNMLRNAEVSRGLRGIRIAVEAPSVTHLLFADAKSFQGQRRMRLGWLRRFWKLMSRRQVKR